MPSCKDDGASFIVALTFSACFDGAKSGGEKMRLALALESAGPKVCVLVLNKYRLTVTKLASKGTPIAANS